MRVEPYAVDSIIHVVKRGARGAPITRDLKDERRFNALLFYMNDRFRDEYWERSTSDMEPFGRPVWWPERDPLVDVLAWALMPNHLHLVLKEIREGGIAKFTQKVFGSMTTHFNAKYDERGSLFQGSYRGRTVDEDEYLRYLAVYVMIKNPFELYPGGLVQAVEHFDDAYERAAASPLCSLSSYAHGIDSPILDKDIMGELFEDPVEFKDFARDCMQNRLEQMKLDFGQV